MAVACGDLTSCEKYYRCSHNVFRAIISSMLVRYSMNSLLYQELTGIVERRGFRNSIPLPPSSIPRSVSGDVKYEFHRM